jgi:flagellar biosynthesis/type III secretory pathway protein FliH
MPILKQQPASRPLIKDAVVLDLGDLNRQAAQLRQQAEAKAKQILAEANAEADRLTRGAEAAGHEAGYAAGYDKGLEEGRASGREQAFAEAAKEAVALTQQWQALAQQWEADREDLHRLAREQVLDFALALARKTVHRLVEVDRQIVVEQVGRALERLLEPTDVTIAIHPEDRPTLDAVLPDILARFSHLKHVKVREEAEVGRGGCTLCHGEGGVDASMTTQLQRIAELIAPGREQIEIPETARETPAE